MDRRLPASIEDLCRLVCKDELTASGAVLCGSRWVPLSQLIDVPEARRIGAAAMRRGKLDAAANPSFDELSGTLCSEIAQRLPRYPVRLHVYDLGQAKGISGLNIVTKGLQMVRPRSRRCSVTPLLTPSPATRLSALVLGRIWLCPVSVLTICCVLASGRDVPRRD